MLLCSAASFCAQLQTVHFSHPISSWFANSHTWPKVQNNWWLSINPSPLLENIIHECIPYSKETLFSIFSPQQFIQSSFLILGFQTTYNSIWDDFPLSFPYPTVSHLILFHSREFCAFPPPSPLPYCIVVIW